MVSKPEQLEFFSLFSNDPVCPVCREAFNKYHLHQIYCSRKCYNKQYLIKNKNKIKESKKLKYIKNKKKLLEEKKRYYIKNREIVLEKAKEYRIKNKNKIKEDKKQYYIKNKEKISKWGKKYRSKNKKIILKKKNNIYKININFKFRHKITSRIRRALIKRKTIKSKKTLELLGCSWNKARKHLESQFKEEMTWENYGKYGWHIDHIIPCASFDLTDPEQQKKCFNYKNLQPLWWQENLSKGSKILN